MTFNPLVHFDSRMIPGFVKMGHRYLVAQTYQRGENPLDREKQPLLLSDHPSLNAAKDHHKALAGDKWGAIVDLENPGHSSKLIEMAAAGSPYLLFVAFVQDKKLVNARTDRYLGEAVRQYIARETTWSPGRGETVLSILELQYGELFLRIKYSGEITREPLAVFEKLLNTAGITAAQARPVYDEYKVNFQNGLPALSK